MIAGNFAFLAADACFPRGSWPWTVGRETAFALANQSQYLQPTLQEFYRDEQIGPLGALLVSCLVQRLDPRLANRFAIRGLRDTSVDGFRHDFLPLVDESALAGRLLARTAIVLQEVDEPTVLRWIGNVPAADRAWVAAAVEQLRQQRQQPVDVAINLALEQAWLAGLRARVVAALAARRGQRRLSRTARTELSRITNQAGGNSRYQLLLRSSGNRGDHCFEDVKSPGRGRGSERPAARRGSTSRTTRCSGCRTRRTRRRPRPGPRPAVPASARGRNSAPRPSAAARGPRPNRSTIVRVG